MNHKLREAPSPHDSMHIAAQDIMRAEKSQSLSPGALAVLEHMAGRAKNEADAARIASIIHRVTTSAGAAGSPRFHLH